MKIVIFFLFLSLLPISSVNGQILTNVQTESLKAESAETSIATVTQELEKLEEKLPAYRKLFDDGLISKRDMEAFEKKHSELLATQSALKAEMERKNKASASVTSVESLKRKPTIITASRVQNSHKNSTYK